MPQEPLRLEPGEELRETFASGEARAYLLSLEEGDYLDVTVEQLGIDVELVFQGPGRDKLVVDSPNGSQGPERLVVVARGSGDHRLEVIAADDATKPGEILLSIPRHIARANQRDERRALAHETFVEADELRRQRTVEAVGDAVEHYRKALALWEELDDRLWQATAWHRLAQAHRMLGRRSEAVDFYRRAGDLYGDLGDSAQVAKTRNLIGRIELGRGRIEEARALFHEARGLARTLGESATPIEATAANNLGELHRQGGESQEAFDHYDAARTLWHRADRPGNEATALHNMGALLHQQGKLHDAADILGEALELHRVHSRHDPSRVGRTLSRRASVYRDLKKTALAGDDLAEALGIYRELADERGMAWVLNNLGTVHRAEGDLEQSLAALQQALGKLASLEDHKGEALVELNLARLHLDREKPEEALALFKKTSRRFRELGQPNLEASAHYGIAWALRDLDRHDEALEQLDSALALVEDLRTQSLNQDLRIAFFASKQHYYDMKIAILMDLNRPELVRQALETSEQRRARALLDVVGEAPTRLRDGVTPDLLEDERRVQGELREIEADLRAAYTATPEGQDLEGLKVRRRKLVLRLGDVRGKIRFERPLYSELVRPRLLTTGDIRAKVLGQETLLLVYSLGPDRSYLWSLAKDGELQSHVLMASREDIEQRVGAAREALANQSESARRRRALGRGVLPQLSKLSDLLLGKVREQLGCKRLVIVADGALQALPFAALPDPEDKDGQPLVVRHEIVFLPSINLLAHTRELWGGRHHAMRKLAVVADPVYGRKDPRFEITGSLEPESPGRSPNQRDLERALRASGPGDLRRLPSTGEEARAIAAMIVRQDMRQVWLDFEASRETVLREKLKDYRMLHFATHAQNVMVTDTLPAGVTFLSTSGCAEDPAGVPACSLGTIAAGASKQYTITMTVDSDTSGVITNTASVSSETTDPDGSNNSTSEDTTVTSDADLSVTKSDSQDSVPAGDPLTYTVTVTNSGPSDAVNVTATDTLPGGVTFVSTSGCLNDPSGVPICDLGTIAAGASAQYTIDVTVDASTPSGMINNTVTVSSDATDPDPGNNTATEDTLVDAEPPTVTLVDSLAGTGDGELAECEEARTGITELLVTFSEPVQDPPGDADPDDVTNPANYLLVASGPDHDFATSACGPPAGDDVAVAIDGVTYDGGTLTATLVVNGGSPLGDSLYRLLVCGSTSIRDVAGNPLDGDSDGTPGDDFVRPYRIERTNIFLNGHFDCTIEDWVPVSTLPDEIGYSPEDIDDSLVSGSAHVTNLSASTDFSLGQCAEVPPDVECHLGVRARIDAAAGVVLTVSRVCEFFSDPGCTGTSLSLDSETASLGDTGGVWELLELAAISPVGATSALCSLDLQTAAGEAFDAFYDDATLSCVGLIFADGFESGDTLAWSSTVR